MKKIGLNLLLILLTSTSLFAQKLDKFGADFGKKTIMGKSIRVPYTDMITYYGYVAPGSKPDEEKDGKKYYYLYIWVPLVAPEIGVRMVSPVPAGMTPEKTDFVSPTYEKGAADKTNFFDTWIRFERAATVLTPADIATKGKTTTWLPYDTNDDSSELPAQPSGNKYNSLMRITSEVSNPTKALVAGLYRVCFTTYKVGEVQGSFVAQVGAPVKLPGTAIAPTLDALAAQVKK